MNVDGLTPQEAAARGVEMFAAKVIDKYGGNRPHKAVANDAVKFAAELRAAAPQGEPVPDPRMAEAVALLRDVLTNGRTRNMIPAVMAARIRAFLEHDRG